MKHIHRFLIFFSGLAACVLRRVSGVAACIHVRLLVFFWLSCLCFAVCEGERPALITHTDGRLLVHATSAALITPHGAGAQAPGAAASKDAFM